MNRVYQTPCGHTCAQLRRTLKLALVTVLFLTASLVWVGYRTVARDCAAPTFRSKPAAVQTVSIVWYWKTYKV